MPRCKQPDMIQCGQCYPGEQGKNGEIRREWSSEWGLHLELCPKHSIENPVTVCGFCQVTNGHDQNCIVVRVCEVCNRPGIEHFEDCEPLTDEQQLEISTAEALGIDVDSRPDVPYIVF